MEENKKTAGINLRRNSNLLFLITTAGNFYARLHLLYVQMQFVLLQSGFRLPLLQRILHL